MFSTVAFNIHSANTRLQSRIIQDYLGKTILL